MLVIADKVISPVTMLRQSVTPHRVSVEVNSPLYGWSEAIPVREQVRQGLALYLSTETVDKSSHMRCNRDAHAVGIAVPSCTYLRPCHAKTY